MTYMYPFDRGTEASQEFGASPGGYNPPGGHTGKDWKVWTGMPIRAAADGLIEAAQYFPDYNNEWLYGPMGGLTIVLDCGPSAPTFGYSHCSASYVNAGDRVAKGQIIGLSGNTGTATTGDHCHNEALPPNWNTYNGTYGRVDPEIYFDEYWDGISAAGSTTPQEDDMPITDEDAAKIAGHVWNFDYKAGTNPDGTDRTGKPLWLLQSVDAIIRETIEKTAAATAHLILNTPVPNVMTGGTTTLATQVSWLPQDFKAVRDGLADGPEGMSAEDFAALVKSGIATAASNLEITFKSTPGTENTP